MVAKKRGGVSFKCKLLESDQLLSLNMHVLLVQSLFPPGLSFINEMSTAWKGNVMNILEVNFLTMCQTTYFSSERLCVMLYASPQRQKGVG